MNSIPITEKDGSEPLPICRTQREWLVDRYWVYTAIALEFFSDDISVAENDTATDLEAIGHVRECPRCREWIHRVVPKDILRRQSRLVQYCCPRMFVAVEEANSRTKNKITFELFRDDEPCWMIDGRHSFISFCPWCGKKLPEHPFITES
jgi:hypothetical protein